jgi:hypothetical protein
MGFIDPLGDRRPSQSLWAATKVSTDLAKIHTGQNSLRIVFSPFSVYRG